MPPGSPETLNQTASQYMKRGIALLAQDTEPALLESLGCFDTAISLRLQLPLEENPWYRWVLAAGYMNRADALTRLAAHQRTPGIAPGSADRDPACASSPESIVAAPNPAEPSLVDDAIWCYDLAIAHLQRLPIEREARFRWRLAVAWLNRGISLRASNKINACAAALVSVENAILLLRRAGELQRLDDIQTLAAALLNRGSLLLELKPAQPRAALLCAQESAALIADDQQRGVVGAELALKSRHLICHAVALLLENAEPDADAAETWIFIASDAVEEALALARHWHGSVSGSGTYLVPVLEEIFHFGTRLYRAFQPHFLAEYLVESQASPTFTEKMREAACEGIAHAALQIRSEGPRLNQMEGPHGLLGTLEKLAEAARLLRAP